MTTVLRAVAGVLMVGLMSPSLVYADSVTITSGVITQGISGWFTDESLSGMDASLRSFSFEGGGQSAVAPGFCHSCGGGGGDVLFVGINSGGSDVGGQVTYGGQRPYGLGFVNLDRDGYMQFSLGGSRSFDMLNLEPGTFVTFIVPFQMVGSFFMPPERNPPVVRRGSQVGASAGRGSRM